MIGIDIVMISRIEQMIEKFGEKALKKFLSEKEIDLVNKPSSAAGFWAAKEAASKALGTGIGAECGFHDIYIAKTSKGAPILTFSDELIKKFAIKDSSLSITHDGGLAIAVVAIEKNNE